MNEFISIGITMIVDFAVVIVTCAVIFTVIAAVIALMIATLNLIFTGHFHLKRRPAATTDPLDANTDALNANTQARHSLTGRTP